MIECVLKPIQCHLQQFAPSYVYNHLPHFAPASNCQGLKRQREESLGPAGSYGGAPLSVAARKNIVHLYYDRLLTPEEIAPLILSPRKISGGVDVRTVLAVLDYFDVYHHVEDTPRAPRALMMPAPHTEMLIDIVKSTPWLFLDEISAELETRCHVKYRGIAARC